jgi:hypothetical protein
MTNFPTQLHWFDTVWPEYDSKRVLVPVQRHTDLAEIERAVSDNPTSIYMLLVEDFDHFSENMPDLWRRIGAQGQGGIPPNAWIGAGFQTQEEADQRIPRLVKLRPRKRFLLFKKGKEADIRIGKYLDAWRCLNCGRRGDAPRPERCPSGNICADMEIGPQIHWVVSMDCFHGADMATYCSKNGVALYDNQSMELPE